MLHLRHDSFFCHPSVLASAGLSLLILSACSSSPAHQHPAPAASSAGPTTTSTLPASTLPTDGSQGTSTGPGATNQSSTTPSTDEVLSSNPNSTAASQSGPAQWSGTSPESTASTGSDDPVGTGSSDSDVSSVPLDPTQLGISPAGGLFEGQVAVTLTATSPTATVRYTLDGTAPNETSPLYAGPITLTESTQVRATAYEETTAVGGLGAVFVARAFDATSALPLIVVDGYGGGKPDQKVDGNWVTKDAAIVVVEPVDGTAKLSQPATLTTRAGYHVRGQSSASFEKAPYKVEFWDANNQDVDLPFLGMEPESDWALIGPYEDRSLVRHGFVYELGRKLGLLAPDFRFAEVYINQDGGPVEAGDYEGIYMVVETIKNNNGRVNLKQLDETDTTEPTISGGYIFKFDWMAAQEPMIECTGSGVIQHGFGQCPTEGAGQFPRASSVCEGDTAPTGPGFPGGGGGGGGGAPPQLLPDGGAPAEPTCWADLEVVDPVPLNAQQQAYLTDYVTAFNDALHEEPKGSYADYIDVASFIDFLIINEFTRNGDAYTRSVYFHKDRGEKIVAGPLWDYNLIMADGGSIFCNDNPVGWAYDFRHGSNDWFQQLIADPTFAAQASARWTELRNTVLSQENLETLLAEVSAPLAGAVEREFTRWPVCEVAKGLFAVPEGDTWEDQLQVMRDFMLARGNWIDSQWAP